MKPKSSALKNASRDNLMAAEAALMKAANEFAYQWGRDQTMNPKKYWLELHLAMWANLARTALDYSECVNQFNTTTTSHQSKKSIPQK